MSYISSEDLSIVKNPLLTLDNEVCGFLLEQKKTDALQLYVDSVGTQIGERGTCQHSKYTKYIWHTHNIGLIAYPSPEDIYTILKFHSNNFENNFPHASIVFTVWGIWEIAFPHRKFDLDKNWTAFLHRVTDESFHPIWVITEQGKGVLGKNSELHIQNTVQAIVKAVNESDKVFDNAFEMYFTPWKKIRKNYHLKSVQGARMGFPTSKMMKENGDIVELKETYDDKPFFRKTKPSYNELYIAKLLQKFPQKHVVEIYRANEDYIDMELLNIETDVINIKDLIDARDEMISIGIVYIDWKIDNIGLSRDGIVKIFDFDASGVVDKDGKWIVQAPELYTYRKAVKAGMKTPLEIDEWAFEHGFLPEHWEN